MLDFLLKMFFILAPMYFANSSALIFGGKRALDFNKNFIDGKRIFGKGKTFEGTLAGIAAGLIVTVIIFYLFRENVNSIFFDYLTFGILITFGCVIGDIVASFIKRRINKQQGTSVPLLDQLDFVVGGILFGSIA